MSNKQITGNIGLYYVCYKLAKLNWNVLPTARNAVGVDIVAYNEDSTRQITIQVKSLLKRNPVPLGEKITKLPTYWVIVNQLSTESPNCYILLPKDIEKVVSKGGTKAGKDMYWINPPNYDKPEYLEKWARIK